MNSVTCRMPMQVKLLRALEESRLRPVGSDQEIDFDVRVLAATHRDLETAVEEGRFRQDLFYRINVIQLHLPPLRARATDILTLARHYVEHFARKSNKPVSGIAEPAAEKVARLLLAGKCPRIAQRDGKSRRTDAIRHDHAG